MAANLGVGDGCQASPYLRNLLALAPGRSPAPRASAWLGTRLPLPSCLLIFSYRDMFARIVTEHTSDSA